MRGVRGPAIRAVMARRVLVNYRIEPEVLKAVLPAPFRSALAGGYGVGSICLIRLSSIRATGLVPAAFGLRAENVAHRFSVLVETPHGPTSSVYIPQRYTSSRIAALTRDLFFPRLRLARFGVDERHGRYRIGAESLDGTLRVEVDARIAETLPPGSVFADLDEASRFIQLAPVGYSDTALPGVFDAVTLEASYREVHPLRVDEVASSLFDDPRLFPPGTVTVDSAFAAAGLATWRPLPRLRHAVPAGRP
jgi:hypothetical protein